MKKLILPVFYCFLALLWMPGAVLAASAVKPIVITVATMHPLKHPLTQEAFMRYGKEVERRTHGKVEFKWFPAGSLVQWDQAQQAVTGGLVDMVMGLPIFMNESLYPVTSILQTLFFCDSSSHFSETAYLAYQTIPEMRKEYSKYKPLAIFSTSASNIHTVGPPPKTADALKGMTVLVGSANAAQLFKSWGAAAQYIKTQDAYMALQSGMAKAIFFPDAPLNSFKLTDMLRGHTIGNFNFGAMVYAMNMKKWKSLPPDVQKVFEDMTRSAGCLAGAVLDEEADQVDATLRKRGDDFYYLTPAQKVKWKKATGDLQERLYLNPIKQRGLDAKAIWAKLEEAAEQARKNPCKPDSWWGGVGERN